ncbi:MAG: ATP phosphoribosyltransferase regulatory subunit [Sulfurovum sp. AS07-7]|nr:MAG: ATP phosphoribosyltransferase regulatory subunit [Sulfurovum sp. AS07-7]
MIFEHEIPSKSKLYFSSSAKIKRAIESKVADFLDELGYEEIVTPIFSYHQEAHFEDSKELLRLSDKSNHTVTLRADSTSEVVRIVTKRLGRSMEHKKWFYIQPILSYPTTEINQIGIEIIDGEMDESLEVAIQAMKLLEIGYTLQISNSKIPMILMQKYGVELKLLEQMNIEKIFALDIPWIKKLVRIASFEDLSDFEDMPCEIVDELLAIKEVIEKVSCKNVVISPLFYENMRYYDSLTFRMFEQNSLLVHGGVYQIDNVNASGFAIYTDECVNKKMKGV